MVCRSDYSDSVGGTASETILSLREVRVLSGGRERS